MNEINLTGMTEEQRTAKAAELRKQAQLLLNEANITESQKVISADEQKVVEQIRSIGERTTNQLKCNETVVPIVPIEPKPAEINLIGQDDGQGQHRIVPLYMDKHTSGTTIDKQRDCSKCLKWAQNHCLAGTPAPRRQDGSCDQFMELQELKEPRYIVKVYCPICHNHLSDIEISAPIKTARCYNCEVDIAGIWLSRTYVIKDMENGETNSNKKLQEQHKTP